MLRSELEKRRKEIAERAKNALSKKASYGPDLDIFEFDLGDPNPEYVDVFEELPESYWRRAENVGVLPSEEERSGTYFQIDQNRIFAMVAKDLREKGVIIDSTYNALRKYDWAWDYYWKAVPVDLDKYTAAAELHFRHGYFIYVPPGVKVERPIQACLFISRRGVAQPVHNIIIVDEGAELNLVTGCTAAREELKGLHIGISEFYVKRNAKLTFTMIHAWGTDLHVRPRAVTIVEEGGEFINYYVNFHPVKSLQMYPTAILKENARASLSSILVGRKETYMDVGGRIVLEGRGARGEVTSRGIGRDRAHLVARGHLVGKAPDVKAHLECRGLMLSDESIVEAIPALSGYLSNVDLTHEAAVGRISEEELMYLMARGFDETEATSIIVRGFLDIRPKGLPKILEREIERIIDVTAKYASG